MTIDKILHLLEVTNTSAKTLLAATGLAGSAVSEWKRRKAGPSAAAVVKIADYFSVPVIYLLEVGVFKNWDEILLNKDSVWNALRESELENAYLITESGRSLLALFDEVLYYEPNDLAAIKLFSWAVKEITFEKSNAEFPCATIVFSEALSLVSGYGANEIKALSFKEIIEDFEKRQKGDKSPVFSLNEDEFQLISLYKTLDDIDKGMVIEKAHDLACRRSKQVVDLLGETTPPAKAQAAGSITEGEAELISAYREADLAIRRSVRKLLDLDADEGLQLVAARDGQTITARTEEISLPDEDSPLP